MPVLANPLPPGMYPDPASLGAEPQGMFPFTKNSGSGFNPNATPFIPTFVQRLPGQPVAAAAGDASPQGVMGVPLDQLPRGVVVQSPHMQAMYPNQFNQHQVSWSRGWCVSKEQHFVTFSHPFPPHLVTRHPPHTCSVLFCTPSFCLFLFHIPCSFEWKVLYVHIA